MELLQKLEKTISYMRKKGKLLIMETPFFDDTKIDELFEETSSEKNNYHINDKKKNIEQYQNNIHSNENNSLISQCHEINRMRYKNAEKDESQIPESLPKETQKKVKPTNSQSYDIEKQTKSVENNVQQQDKIPQIINLSENIDTIQEILQNNSNKSITTYSLLDSPQIDEFQNQDYHPKNEGKSQESFKHPIHPMSDLTLKNMFCNQAQQREITTSAFAKNSISFHSVPSFENYYRSYIENNY